MYPSTVLTAASLFALSFAAPELVKKQNTAAIASSISSAYAQITFPASIAAQLTAVPASVTSALASPSGAATLYLELSSGAPPAWFLALPQEVQTYIIGLAPKFQNLVSLEAAAGVITIPGKAATGTGAVVTATPGSNTTITTAKLSTSAAATGTAKISPGSLTGSATVTGGAASATSKAGAQPTGAIAAGIMGAAGFLGLVMAL
ncbi:hypothetical protein B0J14DRAFT_321754 [Halenospora varia]|nr:hypothetical protein B0J14DRAFT_321754 [Halenospora varia]